MRRYFAEPSRRCLLVAGAGFDPRSTTVARLLAGSVKQGAMAALFVRERRPKPDVDLVERGERHADALSSLVSGAAITDVEVLSAEDGAVVGGHRVVKVLRDGGYDTLHGVTDVVLDMSALSIGISFPIAQFLLKACERAGSDTNFHVLAASHPQVDGAIASIYNDTVDPIRGFSGGIDLGDGDQEPKIWLPLLAPGRGPALQRIRDKMRGPVSVCPVLPISQRNPRAAEELIEEFQSELYQEWEVDPRNLVYAIEDDPLDFYRTVSAINARYGRVFKGVTPSHTVLSPSGNKVLAIGALMAALEHELAVRYVEAVEYSVDWAAVETADPEASSLVHVWLHGTPYSVDNTQPMTAVP